MRDGVVDYLPVCVKGTLSGVFGHQQQLNIDERPSHTPSPMTAGAGWHCSVAGTGERTALSLFECKKRKEWKVLRCSRTCTSCTVLESRTYLGVTNSLMAPIGGN